MCCAHQTRVLLVALSIFWGTSAAANYEKAKRFFDQNNYEAALIEANRSAENGDADSLNLLGVIYEEGLGVKINLSKAVSNFELAIE